MTTRRIRLTTALSTSAVLLSALLGPAAFAQPVDDPGMPADSAPPVVTPPPVIPPTRVAVDDAAPPPAYAPPPGAYTETVEESVTWQKPPRETSIQFYDRTATASYGGPIGLLHTLTGDAGNQGTFRLSMNFGIFKGDSFLIKGNSSVKGDTDSHFGGDITLSYTPWKYLEVYASLFNSSNKNTRVDPGRTDPEVILALGDFAFGVKGRIPVHRSFDLALHLGVKFLNGVSGVSFSPDSTNFAADLIGTWDARKINANVPLRLHLNFGYYLDKSDNLFPSGQCATSAGNDACIRSRVVETFAYGVGAQRLKIALALDVPLLLGPVGLQPFFEYHNEVSLGDGDGVIRGALINDPNVSNHRLTSRDAQYITIGARVRPVAGLILTAAVDVGLTSVGFAYGAPTMPWQVVLGLAYAYDHGSRAKVKVVARTVTRTPTGPVAGVEGHVRGIVRDAVTKKPLARVVVEYPSAAGNGFTPQLTGADGTFVSYGLAPGPVSLNVSRDDYQPEKVSTDVHGGADSAVEVLLQPKPPEAGAIKVRVSDTSGPVASATVRFISPKGPVVEADPDPAGGMQARLPSGDYTVETSANGYLARSSSLTVTAGQQQTLEIQLRKKPKVSRVTLGKGEILIKGTVHFNTNGADILPDGQQLLDEVVDVLIANPQIKHIRIEGHTDNRGNAKANLELSKNRARSVLDYMAKQGVDASRLESEGYGASQPLVPNITNANRARNRRVAFKIVDQS